jgi:hypothetical protein
MIRLPILETLEFSRRSDGEVVVVVVVVGEELLLLVALFVLVGGCDKKAKIALWYCFFSTKVRYETSISRRFFRTFH